MHQIRLPLIAFVAQNVFLFKSDWSINNKNLTNSWFLWFFIIEICYTQQPYQIFSLKWIIFWKSFYYILGTTFQILHECFQYFNSFFVRKIWKEISLSAFTQFLRKTDHSIHLSSFVRAQKNKVVGIGIYGFKASSSVQEKLIRTNNRFCIEIIFNTIWILFK